MIVVTERAYFAKDFGMVWVREPNALASYCDHKKIGPEQVIELALLKFFADERWPL